MLNKVVLFVLYPYKKCSRYFITLRLNHWWQMEYPGDAFHTFLDLDSVNYLAVNGHAPYCWLAASFGVSIPLMSVMCMESSLRIPSRHTPYCWLAASLGWSIPLMSVMCTERSLLCITSRHAPYCWLAASLFWYLTRFWIHTPPLNVYSTSKCHFFNCL